MRAPCTSQNYRRILLVCWYSYGTTLGERTGSACHALYCAETLSRAAKVKVHSGNAAVQSTRRKWSILILPRTPGFSLLHKVFEYEATSAVII
eukprot:COSAG05_NODE_9736_length_605_cov_0.626482_1_plen_92_part_10